MPKYVNMIVLIFLFPTLVSICVLSLSVAITFVFSMLIFTRALKMQRMEIARNEKCKENASFLQGMGNTLIKPVFSVSK